MKKVFYFVYLIVLVYGIIGVSTAKAQIVLAGDSICTANAYVISTAFNNVSCVGQARCGNGGKYRLCMYV